MVPISSNLRDLNIIGSYTIYKLELNDDKSLLLKAQIALRGNDDLNKENLNTAWPMCPPLSIRIVTTTASTRKWRVVRVDAKCAFLQTGPATKIVYVRPPREPQYRNNFSWLVLLLLRPSKLKCQAATPN